MRKRIARIHKKVGHIEKDPPISLQTKGTPLAGEGPVLCPLFSP